MCGKLKSVGPSIVRRPPTPVTGGQLLLPPGKTYKSPPFEACPSIVGTYGSTMIGEQVERKNQKIFCAQSARQIAKHL